MKYASDVIHKIKDENALFVAAIFLFDEIHLKIMYFICCS